MKTNSLWLICFSLMLAVAGMNACTKDFDKINTNPHGFTNASNGSLFNNIVASLIPTGNELFYIQNEIFYKQTQQAALTKSAWGNFTLGTEDMWKNYYTALPNFRELENRLETYDTIGEVRNIQAMLKITLALKTFKMTDVFGDMPFSEAGYGFQDLDFLRPKYDTQREIYLSLLDELSWADRHIQATAVSKEPFKSFVAFDKLFNGDMTKWRKLANSLRLRHAVRMYEKETGLAGAIIQDIIQNEKPVFFGYDFITPKLESACLWPSVAGFKNEALNWSFREHNNLRMGEIIWHQLSVNDNADGSGISDPRAYIFFETNNANQWKPYPQPAPADTPPSGGIPYGTHRDQDGAFDIKGETNIYSPFNYFVVRDEDHMPIIFITGAEIHFLRAEIFFKGMGVAQDKMQAEIEYLNGINASVEWWMNVAANSTLPNSGLRFPALINIPQGLSSSSVQNRWGFWNASDDETKLRFIYAQAWIDAFRQPEQAYALLRRTGLTPRTNEILQHFRMPYPPSEAAYNAVNLNEAIQRQGGDNPEVKLWWIP